MAIRVDYNSVEQFVEILEASRGRQVYAIQSNVTTSNPQAQSFAVALPISALQSVGNQCLDYALFAMFEKWKFKYIKERFEDLPAGCQIDDDQFGNAELALAYLDWYKPESGGESL